MKGAAARPVSDRQPRSTPTAPRVGNVKDIGDVRIVKDIGDVGAPDVGAPDVGSPDIRAPHLMIFPHLLAI